MSAQSNVPTGNSAQIAASLGGEQRVAVLVAGMHRSGTSVLARTLALLGCDLPKTPADDPEQGESKVIIDLNDEILSSVASSWYDWQPFNNAWYSSQISDTFRKRARAALENEFGNTPLFILKDPRICRLLSFWIEAIDNFRATPVIVLPIRNPLEVAESLRARDKIDTSIGLLMWLRHVLEAERASRDLPRVFFCYGDLLSGWQSVVAKLGQRLGIAWPNSIASVALEIDTFVSPTKRHHRVEDSNIVGSLGISPWIQSTYEIFVRWARDDVRETDRTELDRIRAVFDEAAPIFGRPVFTSQERAANLKAQMSAQARQYKAKLAARDRIIERLEASPGAWIRAPLRAISRAIRFLLRKALVLNLI